VSPLGDASSLTIHPRLVAHNRGLQPTTSLPPHTRNAAIVFVRLENGWLSEIVSGNDATLDLPEPGIGLPLQ
jgi:hypothetical protein